nr:phage/plasmid primase, P4 family [Fusobacterium gastrosuis]
MKFKEAYKGFYKGGTGDKAKAPAITKEKAKDIINLFSYADIDKYDNYLGYLKDDYILVDLDNKINGIYDENKTESKLLIEILKTYGIDTPIIETNHGHHFIFKCPADITSNITGELLPIGLRADYKLGSKWGWQVLKYNGKIRTIINDTNNIADLPQWLKYDKRLKNKLENLENERGVNGRNNFISSYKYQLLKSGYSELDTYKICEIINNHLMYEPINMKEFTSLMREEAELMKEVDQVKKFNFLVENKQGNLTVITHLLAEKVIHDNQLISINDYIYGYNGKSYEYIEHKKIKNKILQEYKSISTSKWNEAMSKLDSLLEPKEINLNYVSLKNGLLNIDTLEIEPHNKDIITTFYIDVNYNPLVNTETVEKYLMELVGEDREVFNILTEFIGYILYPKNIMKKALIIKGEHNNGKSKFIDVLTSLFGYENCSILDMKQMASRFGLTGLIGKIVNFGDDISDQYINEDSDIKKAISGEPLMIESKGKDSKQYSMNVKFLFSANTLPRFKDPTGAISTRFIIVPFPVTYSKENGNIDFKIVEKMTTPENMEAFLMLALSGLNRLLTNKCFTYSQKAQMMLDEFNEDNNPILTFINEKIKGTIQGKMYFNNKPTNEIYRDYELFCTRDNYKPISKQTFSKQLKRFVPELDVKFNWNAGKSERYYYIKQ